MANYQYGIIDSAQDKAIYPLIEKCSNYESLFAGPLKTPLLWNAPYIVEMKPSEPLMNAWQGNWENNWGILVYSEHSLKVVRSHLRRFLTVKLPNGSSALFRFYDPRVFDKYWESSNTIERKKITEKLISIHTIAQNYQIGKR